MKNKMVIYEFRVTGKAIFHICQLCVYCIDKFICLLNVSNRHILLQDGQVFLCYFWHSNPATLHVCTLSKSLKIQFHFSVFALTSWCRDSWGMAWAPHVFLSTLQCIASGSLGLETKLQDFSTVTRNHQWFFKDDLMSFCLIPEELGTIREEAFLID